MIPDEVPVFTKDDMLHGTDNEYRIGDKASTVGWLKELFLYGSPDREYTIITDKDRKDYHKVEETFKRVNGISLKVDLHDWEDDPKNIPTKQAKALNKCMKELDYE